MTPEELPSLEECERRCVEATRRYEELINNPRYVKKPVAVVTMPVSEADAKKVQADPESLRLHTRRQDGVSAVIAPLGFAPLGDRHVRVRVDWVREVDAQGRPVWDQPGAQHEYNPLDALKK
jgi:putative intracellular protease/amidase